MATVLDYAGGVPSAAAIKAAGHIGAVRYLSPPRPGAEWMAGKPVHRAELDDFDAHGLKMAMCWQYNAGGRATSDTMRGYEGGVADAKAAQAQLDKIQAARHPVFFCVDFHANIDDWNNTIVHYFRGAASVLGKQRVGVYGSSRLVHWAMEDDVVAVVEPGRVLGWVAGPRSWGSWDGDRKRGRDYAVLFQHPTNVPGPDGVQVDENEVFHPEFGWRNLDDYEPEKRDYVIPENISMRPNPGHRGDPLFLPDLLKLWGVEVREFDGWRSRGHGDFNHISHVVAHHTAGANTPPSLIAYGHSALRGLLSQIHLARDGVATLVGAGVAWHAGAGRGFGMPVNAANWETIGVEAVNAGDGSQPWTAAQMKAYKLICAAIAWYLGKTAAQVIGHKEWSSQKIDPNFSMPQFRNEVQALIDNPPFMKLIEEKPMVDLNKRYKFRTPEGYYEGDEPGSGNLVDVWLNTDTHAWVARVNTQRLLNEVADLKQTVTKQAQDQAELVQALADLTVVLAKGNN